MVPYRATPHVSDCRERTGCRSRVQSDGSAIAGVQRLVAVVAEEEKMSLGKCSGPKLSREGNGSGQHG